jgi:hypothetical protein
MAGVDEEGHEADPDHPGRTGDEHSHAVDAGTDPIPAPTASVG